MGIALEPNQYAKADNRIGCVYRGTDRPEICDLNVSTSLRGAFSEARITGEQGDVLPAVSAIANTPASARRTAPS